MGIHDDETKPVILELENKLSNEGLKIIEIHDRNWFRVSVPKGGILFQEEFFEYELHNPDVERWELILLVNGDQNTARIIPSKRFVCRLPSEKDVQIPEDSEEWRILLGNLQRSTAYDQNNT